jgi:soluble lytic murein transglycosylase-like protein
MKKCLCTVLCFLIFSFFLSEVKPVLAAPFTSSREYQSMQNSRSPRDQHNKTRAIESYFRRVNPRLSAANASRYAGMIEKYAAHYKLDPFLVAAILVKESTVKPNAVSKGNYGLMQINWKANGPWIRKTFPVRNTKQLLEPENNIRIGAHILAANIQRAKGDVDKGLDRYRGRSLASYRNSVMRHYSSICDIFRRR